MWTLCLPCTAAVRILSYVARDVPSAVQCIHKAQELQNTESEYYKNSPCGAQDGQAVGTGSAAHRW